MVLMHEFINKNMYYFFLIEILKFDDFLLEVKN